MLHSSQSNISNVLGGVCHQGRSMPSVDGSLLRFLGVVNIFLPFCVSVMKKSIHEGPANANFLDNN